MSDAPPGGTATQTARLSARHGIRVRAALGATAAIAVAGCSHAARAGDAPTLRQPAQAHWTADTLDLEYSKDWVVGSLLLCLDRPGKVTVTDVQAYGGHLRLAGWALRPNPFQHGGQMIGSIYGNLASTGVVSTPSVTQACSPTTGAGSELIVSLHATVNETAKAAGLAVTYSAPGARGRTVKVAHGLSLCAPADRATPACELSAPTS